MIKPSWIKSNVPAMFFIGLLFIEVTISRNATGQCTPTLESMAESADAAKCGFPECSPSSPPKIFLIDTYAASIALLETLKNGPYTVTSKYQYNEHDITTQDPIYCTNSAIDSGSASYKASDSDGTSYEIGGNLHADGSWDPGGIDAGEIGNPAVLAFTPATETNICTSTTSGEVTTGSYAYTESGGYWAESGTLTVTINWGLSKEYKDDMLRSVMIGKIPPYGPDYVTNWGVGSSKAFYHVSPDHKSCSGGRMKYKFYLCSFFSMAKGQSFTIKWKQSTTLSDSTNPPSLSNMQESITGNGDPNGMYGSEHDVDVPPMPCDIYEIDPTITADSSSPPGSGGGGGGGGWH